VNHARYRIGLDRQAGGGLTLGDARGVNASEHSDASVLDVTAPEVSIVIVNWNGRDLLRQCLLSIEEQTCLAHEVLVVDNASVDGSVDMIRREWPTVKLIANSMNRGFAAANNQGLTVAQGRYVLLLNPDTVILDRAIDRMIDWCDKHPDVGCAGCQVMMSDTEIQQTCFADHSPFSLVLAETGLARLFSQSRVLGRPQYSWWDRRSEMDVDVVSGMFMLIPRSVLGQTGLLDESFFVYAEEADFCRRIRKAGFRCAFTPIARIIHLDGGNKSTEQVSVKMHVQLQKSLLIYITKHYGRAGRAVAKTTLCASKSMRYVILRCLSVVSKSSTLQRRVRQERASVMYHLFGREPNE
jgi:GT2 family glycosyltransferase